MVWKPLHEAHAIERVRVTLPFKEPLTSKLLRFATEGLVSSAAKLGFDSVSPAESAVATININTREGATQAPSVQNGIVLRRHSSGTNIEEAGFRDGAFGYVTSTYGRWENLLSRFDEVIFPALEKVKDAADLGSMKLEYWDAFVFEGNPDQASPIGLLSGLDGSLPEEVSLGQSHWHSHVGWFETNEFGPVLINRNFDSADRQADKEMPHRVLQIYSMVEQRNSDGISVDQVHEIIDTLHNRSLKLFGSSLDEEYRKSVGIDLETYK